jgi:hypothetical protein
MEDPERRPTDVAAKDSIVVRARVGYVESSAHIGADTLHVGALDAPPFSALPIGIARYAGITRALKTREDDSPDLAFIGPLWLVIRGRASAAASKSQTQHARTRSGDPQGDHHPHRARSLPRDRSLAKPVRSVGACAAPNERSEPVPGRFV